MKNKLPRNHRISIMLNDEEKKLINNHIIKYKHTTVAKFMRETAVRAIFQQIEKDMPTLFD
jgi:hypothetical protein